MPKNIEIKAYLKNAKTIHKIAKELSDGNESILKQEDTFFGSSEHKNGTAKKLKLRQINSNVHELILYDRPKITGPKLSTFKKAQIPTSSSCNLKEILENFIGKIGTVKKTRTLYMIGQTRVHIDKVEGLGDFLELEVMLEENQSLEEGKQIANDLMKKLNVAENDLIDVAYIDMITSAKQNSDLNKDS